MAEPRRWRTAALSAMVLVFWTAGCVGGDPVSTVATVCLRGTVTDTDGRPIPFATLRSTSNGEEVIADYEGDFTLCVPKGPTTIHVGADGHKDKEVNADVQGNTVWLIIQLESFELDLRTHVTHELHVQYRVGASTVDTLLQRRGTYLGNCKPCSFNLSSPQMPDYLLLEADWTRELAAPPDDYDRINHDLQAGAPFGQGETFSATGSTRPYRFLFERSDYENLTSVGTGPFAFSIGFFCGLACGPTSIDAYLTFFYNYTVPPEQFTAKPA